jgi:AcrR family transcriptional regulator
MFRDRGFDGTSVGDVARALGLTKAGLYHYFDSKEALLFEILMYGLDRVRDDVIVPIRAIRDPEERLRQLIVRHARIATHGRGAVAGKLKAVHPTVATFSLLGMILWLPRWFRQDGPLSQDVVATQIADMALGGLLKPKRAGLKACTTTTRRVRSLRS